jgi:hypothetical protein
MSDPARGQSPPNSSEVEAAYAALPEDGDALVRAEPFEAIELDFAALFRT